MCFNQSNKMKNEITNQYTLAQLELLEMVNFNGALEIANGIMLIHDTALYHSDCSIDEEEKTALYQLRLLSDIIKQISREV